MPDKMLAIGILMRRRGLARPGKLVVTNVVLRVSFYFRIVLATHCARGDRFLTSKDVAAIGEKC